MKVREAAERGTTSNRARWEKQLKDVIKAIGNGLKAYEESARSILKICKKRLKEAGEAIERWGNSLKKAVEATERGVRIIQRSEKETV
jgi:transposase